MEPSSTPPETKPTEIAPPSTEDRPTPAKPRETGGPKGKEPTRFGDWERNGRCIDF